MTLAEAKDELENAALSVAIARTAYSATLNFGFGVEVARAHYDAKLDALQNAAERFADTHLRVTCKRCAHEKVFHRAEELGRCVMDCDCKEMQF